MTRKVISIKKPVIEIPIVDDTGATVTTFTFDKTDENLKRLNDVRNNALKEIGIIASKTEEELKFEEVKQSIARMIDDFLGEGSFNLLYDLSPSLDIIIYYFVEICSIINDEIQTNLGLDLYE